jgi:hypothetical protein
MTRADTRRRLPPRRTRFTTAPAAAAVAGVLMLGLAGCTGPGAESGLEASSGAADATGSQRDSLTRQGEARGFGTGTTTAGAQAPGLLSRDLIQRASLTVTSRHVGEALEQVRVIVAGVQGVVAEEHTETGRHGEPEESSLTLRVPAVSFDAVVQDLTRLGRLRSQQVTTQDVSTQVVDVEARIVSAERTLRRIRELLEQADDFSDVLSLESELARREADLSSLKAQQAYLQDQTSLSTISLTLLRPAVPPKVVDEEPAGFVAGLGVGWDALVGLLTVVLTALGVLLPLLLVLVPLGALAWWGLRRAVRRPTPTATE